MCAMNIMHTIASDVRTPLCQFTSAGDSFVPMP